MAGAGSHSGRNHSGDRFYNPPAARRQMQLQQQQQQQQQQQVQATHRSNAGSKTKMVSGIRESERRSGSGESSAKPSPMITTQATVLSSPPSGNLDRFLESTTPFVPAQYPSKTSIRDWRTCDGEFHPFFTLGDLWESYKEWSAYGAGVPLVLNGSDCVVQYYVPYLSGIQIYVDSTKPTFRSRRPGEESDGEYRDTSSEGSSDSEVNRGSKHIGEDGRNRNPGLKFDRLSLREKPPMCPRVFSNDDAEPSNSMGSLIFEYLEVAPPYSREPLADKILDLACRFPELKTLKSCDLMAGSWISVAWYPIYRIPTGPTLRDLEACFLTFHSLSTPLRGSSDQSQAGEFNHRPIGSAFDSPTKLSLPVFGLASYKFKGSVWTPNGIYERQQASSLLQAAENWLRLLQVDHPDLRFFLSHNTQWR